MDKTTETYPHRIHKIAMDLTLAKHIMEMELQASRLREITDELEEWSNQDVSGRWQYHDGVYFNASDQG